MGLTAEIVAEKWKINREQQDQFAYNSHMKAIHAIHDNLFKSEIVPYKIDRSNKIISIDDGPRVDTTLEKLQQLKPVFKNKGSVTAGNTSQMSDGAAAVLLVSEQGLTKYGLTPLARFTGFSVAGLAPEIMGVGPVVAIPKCLKKCNLKLDDLDWIELNEAFAAQSLAVINELQLDISKVNPYGGAIALGHPLGATGAIRVATLLHGMRNQNLKYGMVTMCIGTGMGAAGIFEII
jgi:acetyl-CoA acyltransferase